MYIAQKAIKGQELANFVADYPYLDLADYINGINTVILKLWNLMFDESRTAGSARARVIIESPMERVIEYSFQLEFDCSNNQVEYEAFIIDLQILVELKARNARILWSIWQVQVVPYPEKWKQKSQHHGSSSFGTDFIVRDPCEDIHCRKMRDIVSISKISRSDYAITLDVDSTNW